METQRGTAKRPDADQQLGTAIGIANGIALSLSLWCVLGSAWVLSR